MSVALLVPMFATSATGTLDTVDVTPRGYGASGPLVWRLVIETGGSNLYITDPLTLSSNVLTNPGAGHWYVFNSADPYLDTAPTASAYDGTGDITAVGVWLTETVNYAGGGSGPNMAGYGLASLTFNATVIPEPATLSLLAVGGLLALRRRR